MKIEKIKLTESTPVFPGLPGSPILPGFPGTPLGPGEPGGPGGQGLHGGISTSSHTIGGRPGVPRMNSKRKYSVW